MADIQNTTLSFADMISNLYFLINDDENTFPLPDVKGAINTALSVVSRQTNVGFTEIYHTLTHGVSKYFLPEAKLEHGNAVVDSVWINGVALAEIPYKPQELTDEQDLPVSYFISERDIIFDPVPDLDTYVAKISYGLEAPVLVEDNDTTQMDDTAIHAAILYACYLLKMRDEEFESSAAFFAAYREAMGTALYIPGSVYDSTNHRVR